MTVTMGGTGLSCTRLLRAAIAIGLTLSSLELLAADPRTVFAQVSRSVLVLEVFDKAGMTLSVHSAIAVAEGQAVGTCNVLVGAPGVAIRVGDKQFKATVKAQDSQRNLCLLDVPGLSVPLLRRAQAGESLSAGQRVFAVSNALGLGIGISEGVISGIRAFGPHSYVQFSAPVSPGSEGGALVDDEGRLVGVIDYRHRDGQNINFAAPGQWVLEIEGRNLASDERQQLRESAASAAREKKWVELVSLARDWCTKYPDDADAWGWLAVGAAMQKDLDTEDLAWRAMRRIDPAAVAAGIGLAKVMLKRGQNKEALDLARSLLALRQEDVDVWIAIGQAEQTLGHLKPAEEAFRRAISIFPWATLAYEGLVGVAEQRGDRQAVTEAWSRLAFLFPDVDFVQMRLIDSLLREGLPRRAFPIEERLLERMPQSGDAWYWKARVLAALGRPTDAIAAYRRSLELSPSAPAWVWAALAQVCFESKLFPESIHAYREAIELVPDNFNLRFWLAVALKDGGHLHEAIALDEKLVAEHPADPATWRQLGFARTMYGEAEEGATALEHSLSMEPKQGKTWVGLMEAYQAAGRREDVKRTYAKLREIDSDWAEKAYRSLILPYEDVK
jgi:tetratricopeptide (TPR) repeat protein